MNPARPSQNRPGQDPQMFCPRPRPDFSSACGPTGKIQTLTGGGATFKGSNQRTALRMACPKHKTTIHSLPNLITDNNKNTGNKLSVFSKQAHATGSKLSRTKAVHPLLQIPKC